MSRYVVDASVALKFFLPEDYAAEVSLLSSPVNELMGPELLALELSNVLVKKVRRGEASAEAARAALSATLERFELMPTAALTIAALDLSLRHQCSAYDATYVALAIAEGCPLVTADRRLYNTLSPVVPGTMLWIADMPGSPAA